MDNLGVNELGVVGSIMLDERCFPAIAEIVEEDDFGIPEYRHIFGAMLSLRSSGSPIDPITVLGELRRMNISPPNAESLVFEIMDMTPTAANADLYAKELKNESRMRRICRLIQASEKETDADARISSLMDGLYEIGRGRQKSKAVPLAKAADEFHIWLANRDEGRIDFGFPRLDAILRGMRPGNLVVLAARPSVGKSAFAGNLILKCASNGIPCILFSCEMSMLEIEQRFVAEISGVPLDDILNREFRHGEKSAAVLEALERTSNAPILVCDNPSITTLDIRRTIQANPDTKLVVIDYMQLMRAEGGSENRNLEMAKISGELKRIAKEFCVPVVALSQFNRGVDEFSEPSLSGFRDSGAIEQDADIAVLLWRISLPEDGKLGKIGVKVAKNRMGKTGTVVMYFDGAHMRFLETFEDYVPKPRRGRDFVLRDDDLPKEWRK